MKKKCTHCKLPVLLKDFYPDKARSDGLQSICKKCNNQMSKKNTDIRKQSRKDFDRLFIG